MIFGVSFYPYFLIIKVASDGYQTRLARKSEPHQCKFILSCTGYEDVCFSRCQGTADQEIKDCELFDCSIPKAFEVCQDKCSNKAKGINS